MDFRFMYELLAHPDPADLPILDRARDMHDREFGGQVDERAVCDVNSRFGTDLATALLYVHFESRLTNTDSLYSQSERVHDDRPLLVAIVPGAFYKEHPEIGADGRELVELSELHVWNCEVIPCESLGSLNANARIINDFLKNATRTHRVILVTLSKGTADALTARSLMPERFDDLQGWVSVSGVNHGTKMADWMLDRWHLRPILQLLLWWHRGDQQTVEDFRHRPAQPTETADDKAPFPMLHVAGFPLKKHLSCRRARLWHRRFRREGPSDSVVMLADLLRLPGIVIPVWGSDHYMQSGWSAPETIARLIALLEGDTRVSDQRVKQPVTF